MSSPNLRDIVNDIRDRVERIRIVVMQRKTSSLVKRSSPSIAINPAFKHLRLLDQQHQTTGSKIPGIKYVAVIARLMSVGSAANRTVFHSVSFGPALPNTL